MNVPGYIVYGTDNGRTAILCPQEVNHFRRSWVESERCTAILLVSTMLLSVYMPQCGRDEVDYIEALESVRRTLMEGKREIAEDEYRGQDSIEWYGMYGSECKGGPDDIQKKEVVPVIQRFQLHRDQHLDES